MPATLMSAGSQSEVRPDRARIGARESTRARAPFRLRDMETINGSTVIPAPAGGGAGHPRP